MSFVYSVKARAGSIYCRQPLIQMKLKDSMKKVFLTAASIISENTPTDNRNTRPVYQLDCGICFGFCKLCYYVLLHSINFSPGFIHASEDKSNKSI